MLRKVVVSLPPMIRDLHPSVPSATVAELEAALREISVLDNSRGAALESLGPLLLRTESVASSKIEHISASVNDYARALHGSRANASAVSMVGATRALHAMIGEVGRTGRIELSTLTSAHGALMAGDPYETRPGRLRDTQNWIGGSDHSPRGALYVPPPPETVPAYMDDLVAFANRDDLPVLVQAALAHAQFESIHPFTDGNGRIGRALINTILRRRRATTRVVVPLASALVAHRDRYFDLLDAYRAGDPGAIIGSFARASSVAAVESWRSADHLVEVPDRWREMVGRVRAGSAVAKLLAVLPSRPILSVEGAGDAIDASNSSVYAAVERLHGAGVLRPLTGRTRNQVWGAGLILDELEDLGVRIAHAAR